MSNPRQFHIGDILSVTTGRLVSPRHMDGVYDILGWMTGETLFTHQLPRAADQCRGPLLVQHPQLAGIEVPNEFSGESHVMEWVTAQAVRFGEHLPVEPLILRNPPMDPLAELAQMVRPDQHIIVAVVD